MIRTIFCPLFLVGLVACSEQQVAQLHAANSKLVPVLIAVCKRDAVEQPVLVPLAGAVTTAVIPTSASIVAGAVALDTSAIHPAILKACAAIEAVPVAAVPVQPVATLAEPTS